MQSVLPPERDPVPPEISEAVENLQRLSHHLARVLGDKGIRALFARSFVLAGARFPWLASAESRPGGVGDDTWSRLRTSLEHQDPDTAREAFALVLATFVGLLERLIGKRLVGGVLRDVWPAAFRTQ